MTLKRKNDFDILNKIDEKLDAHSVLLGIMGEKIGKIDKTLNGNGQPGLCQKVSSMEKDIARAKGWAIGASTIIGAAWTVITHFVGKK